MNTLGATARSPEQFRLALPSLLYSRLEIVLCAAGLLGLFVVAACSPGSLVYDESAYLEPVKMLDEHGLSLEFLRNYPQPAGLLHNVLHWVLEPLTGLDPSLLRLVNPVLLAVTMLLTFLTLRLLGAARPLGVSLSLIAVPFIWVLAGMVLTEMPAMVLASLSVYLLVLARQIASRRPTLATATAMVGGVMLALAFLSRASVLVILGAVPCLSLGDWRRSLRYVLAFECGALLIVVPITVFWGGLVPPHSVVAVQEASFSVRNLILSCSYGATLMLILAPRWFDLRAQWSLAIVGTIAVLNGLLGAVEIPVARSVVAHLPAIFGAVVPRLAGSAMLGLAVLFVICSARHLHARRHEPEWLFLCVGMLLLIASSGKITHQFSSRYTGMASGMMVMASDPYTAAGSGRTIRLAAGMLIGLSSLLSYYALAR